MDKDWKHITPRGEFACVLHERTLAAFGPSATNTTKEQQAAAYGSDASNTVTQRFYDCGAEPPCGKCITCQWDDARFHRTALAASLKSVLALLAADAQHPWTRGIVQEAIETLAAHEEALKP